MARFYIGYIEISAAMAEKLQSKHGITPDEVREACHRYIQAGWHHHEVHGERLLVIGETRAGRKLKVILQPVDVTDGTWRLRTALVAAN